MPASSFKPRFGRAWTMAALTVGVLVLAGALLVVYAYSALGWYGQPFLGVLPQRDLTVSENGSLAGAPWPARDIGMAAGDRILRVAGVDLAALPARERLDAFYDALNAQAVGDLISVSFLRDDAVNPDKPVGAQCVAEPGAAGVRRCGMNVRLVRANSSDLFLYFGLGWIAGAVLWLASVVFLLRQAGRTQVHEIAALGAALAVFSAGRFDTISTHALNPAWLLAACAAAGLMVALGLDFPYRFAVVQQAPAWVWSPLIAALAVGGGAVALDRSTSASSQRAAVLLALGALLAGSAVLLAIMSWRRGRSASPLVRNQSTLILIGLLPALLPTLIWFGALLLSGAAGAGLVVFSQTLPILLPLTAMYALLQARMVDSDRVITQSALYAVLLLVVTFAYFLVAAGASALIGRSLGATALSPVLVILAVFAVALAFNPLRLLLQHRIDALYFRERRAYQTHLEQFSRDVTNAISLSAVHGLVQRALDQTLAPQHTILFVRGPVAHEYRPLPDAVSGAPLTDLVFAPDSGLVRHLRERATLLYLEEGRPLPLDVVSERGRLALLGAPVIISLRGQRVLNGFLAIGPRKGGGAYQHEDLRFVESLSDPIALAVERAQVVDDLERRVRVQDVLSQVSRALNFAIDLDTLLELIYAQTLRVIDAPCFTIALRTPATDELEYVFYNEGDDRLAEFEGQRWRMGRDLISEIARTQQTLRTDDFLRETLARDPHAAPDNPHLHAWMGVPLLADTGEGVLGVMVAATTQPGAAYTDDQQDLFWDIANLAASAISKLQLFDKTEQRARQLGVINEISRQLASEIGNVDRLLRLITENAVQILNAEAGNLLLADEDTGDLAFHVVVGGGDAARVGLRLPAGSGLAGATLQRGEPIIVNDLARDARWWGEFQPLPDQPAPDADGGAGEEAPFRPQAILSVPLRAGGRAIGVLQILDKRDGSLFAEEDAHLLETFAGQAAIAIENARLFDMTDQQLALRVQELDTMQRIDQELNRTLKLNNVVDITMDWALRKSGASAGALFIRDRERGALSIVASYGYPSGSPFAYDGRRTYTPESGVIARVLRSGQPSLITDVALDRDYEESLPGCVAQLTIPLFSANQVIGVMILESDRDGELDLLDLDFVARLGEHASPAIVNAQLFQELQRANEAKSEFVSFVAHELKNPMTSMRGYTDLLLKGVVGPVNAQQADFLRTVFSNVLRMENLVSDLNDLTKQQTNNLRLDLSAVDFREAAQQAARAQQRQFDEKAQTLTLSLPADLPPVWADEQRLLQILDNFVSNAHKYTPEGGAITLGAEVAPGGEGGAGAVHCAVSDTGIGLSELDLQRLFTPYFRSDNPAAQEQPGTGLGLSITRGLIELHGGRIWVESTLGAGTTFHFTIPLAPQPEPAAPGI